MRWIPMPLKSAIATRDDLIGGASVEEYILSLLERIEEIDAEINSFITVCGGSAIEAAKALDGKRREGGRAGPLSSILVLPIAMASAPLISSMTGSS